MKKYILPKAQYKMYHATEMPFHPSCNYFPRRAYTRDALESLINNLLSILNI
jgi:hypothetical protein